MSDVDNIKNPRKDVMDGFNRQVKEVVANLSSDQEKIQMMAKKQCATADELFADKQAKEISFEEDISTKRKSQVDQNKKHILDATAGHLKITESLGYFHGKVPPVTFVASLYA
eukprot:3058471-Ditylum_brightwellii.AAC.1